MKAIITRYHPCGNVRGARYSATDGDFTIYLSANDALNLDQSHAMAVKELCKRHNWKGTLAQGYIVKRGATAGRVWVWLTSGKQTADQLIIS